MISFGIRVERAEGDHVTLRIFAGPDAEHRASCGTLIMRRDEAWEFLIRNGAAPILDDSPLNEDAVRELADKTPALVQRDDLNWLMSKALEGMYASNDFTALNKINDKYGASATRRRIREARARR